MFIVSQNGDSVRNTIYMETIYEDDGYICYKNDNGGSRVLGKYKTREKALDILNRILDAMARKLNVYRMPKDECGGKHE